MIYLDHNASTQMRPVAKQRMIEVLDITANPSAVHKQGRKLRAYIESARDIVAQGVHAQTSENVIFTSGASEANACFLNGFSDDAVILVSDIDHPSVKDSRDNLQFIPVDGDSLLRLDVLEEMLRTASTQGGQVLVSVALVSSESGVIQDLKKIAELAHKYKAIIHTDAAQAFGRIEIDMQDLGVDALTLAAHKMGGPQGVGALVLRNGLSVQPLLRGGKQEKNRRAGTENAAAIAGFGAAAQEAVSNIASYQKLSGLRDGLETELCARNPETVIHGRNAPRVANTCFFSTPGLDSQALVIGLDLEGVAVSAGTACSSGSTRQSTTLGAIGASEAELNSVLRVSLGWSSTQDDVEGFLTAWEKICARMG